ncbi:MAG: hypothetical protein M3004_03715, partial [Bacteroidota bacterium]|nr:hypothetical protein [Bacteroidota bacterium]
IEVKGNTMPKIKSVVYKGEVFTANIFRIKQTEVAGISKLNGQQISFSPSVGNSLWKIEMSPSTEKYKYTKGNKNKIILQGVKDGHPFTYIIDKEVELESPMYQ